MRTTGAAVWATSATGHDSPVTNVIATILIAVIIHLHFVAKRCFADSRAIIFARAARMERADPARRNPQLSCPATSS